VGCTVIVPFLNERAYIGRFLRSLERQATRPDRVLLVDDGSTDGSSDVAREFARDRSWVTVWRRPERPLGADRLHGAPEFAAFLWGVERLDDGEDILVKMDADLELAPRHFETLMQAFDDDPRLGIAGTYLRASDARGRLRTETHPAEHVRGPTRFYRRACFDAISPLPVVMGWDGADEVRARAHGWRTRSIELPGPQTVHLRPTGAQDGRLRAHVRWGACAYAVGHHPLGVLAGGLVRIRNRPPVVSGIAYVAGWLTAPFRDVARAPLDIREAKRREQLARLRSQAARLVGPAQPGG
jgi:poly-beta-1,6-N-acetyl-D-glucosamine synthase